MHYIWLKVYLKLWLIKQLIIARLINEVHKCVASTINMKGSWCFD